MAIAFRATGSHDEDLSVPRTATRRRAARLRVPRPPPGWTLVRPQEGCRRLRVRSDSVRGRFPALTTPTAISATLASKTRTKREDNTGEDVMRVTWQAERA